jgi:hypothetical protein
VARNWDGTDDQISYGSDASVDDIFAAAPNTGSIALWFNRNATGVHDLINKQAASVGWELFFRGTGGNSTLRGDHSWTGVNGDYESTTQFGTAGVMHHVVVTYDGSSTSNSMQFYVNGGGAESTVLATSTGTIESDAAQTLRMGETATGGSDANHVVGWLVITKTILDAEQRNRHRWWGRIGGAPLIQHPFVTDKTTNEGTGTADASPTGTSVVAFPRVQRPGGMCMMGCGI